MLFEKLTADEQEIISIMRENYVDNDSDFFSGLFVDNRTFLRFWEEAKAPMIEAFGNHLIVKKPLNTMVGDDELYRKMRKVFEMPEFALFKNTLIERLEQENGDNWTTYSYGYHQILYEQVVHHLLTVEEWVSNRYEGITCEIKIGTGNILKLTHGCKVMKVLGRMAKACGEDIAEKFEILRLRQSQALNEARMNANLCISIHPLDFMTASYNNNDWHSCMCWENGEYRRGVIEMMNSPMVVVAYLESKSTVLDWYNGRNMPKLEWNSKRWREFFIVRPDMISGIKGYPYWNRTLENIVINWLAEMFAPIFNTRYAPIMEWRVDEHIYNEKNNIDTYVDMDCGPAMYNDFYSGNDYHTRFAIGLHGDQDESCYTCNIHNRQNRMTTKVFYSGVSECVVCGEPNQDFDSESELACCDCIEHYYCTCCGDQLYSRQDIYEVNGNYYCPYCYEQLDTCCICDEHIDTNNDESTLKFVIGYYDYNNDCIRVEDKNDILHEAPNENNEQYYYPPELREFNVCKNCAEKIFKNGIDELYAWHSNYREFYQFYTVVPLSHLTDFAIKHIIDPDDLKYFKASHEAKTISA